MVRAYDNSRRAAAAERTREAVTDAAEALLREGPLRDATLQAIAARSGVAVQTVLRGFASRDGVLRALAERLGDRIAAQRGASSPGDVEAALDALVAHYEAEGRLVLGLLAEEADDALAREAVARGRAFHRAWVARGLGVADDDDRLDALVAATDLYVWKLLRLDLGRPVEAVRATLGRLVHAVLEAP